MLVKNVQMNSCRSDASDVTSPSDSGSDYSDHRRAKSKLACSSVSLEVHIIPYKCYGYPVKPFRVFLLVQNVDFS